MKKSPWQHLRDHPPALCRLWARRKTDSGGVVAMSNREIAIGAGMPLPRVVQIAGQVTWGGVTIDECERFLAGCNFDPLDFRDRNRKSAYTRTCQSNKTKFRFLKAHPAWATEMKPLISLLRAHLG